MKTWIAVIVAVVIVLLAILLLETTHSPLMLFGSSQGLSVSTSTMTASTTEYTARCFVSAVRHSRHRFTNKGDGRDRKRTISSRKRIKTSRTENGYGPYYFDCNWGSPYEDSASTSRRASCVAPIPTARMNLPVIIGATYDRATAKPVTLDQALALTGMTLDQVASSSKQQLAQNPDTAPIGMWASGSDPVAENYQTFLINQSSVMFIFQPYQVAPFSSGAPEVSIPRVK